MYKRIFALALPNIISNISVPLLSIVDTALAGRMASTASLGAVALASSIVSFSFWLWGFLRMATTGFTAQAYGRDDQKAEMRQFAVGSFIAVLGGLIIILLTPWLTEVLVLLGEDSPSLLPEAKAYLQIAYWGAPAALLLYVYNAWFIGMQNTIVPMVSTIVSNILNIVFSIAFVYWGDMGVEGIALGTVVAQYTGALILLGVALTRYHRLFTLFQWRDLTATTEVFSYIHIAKYLILRTLMLGSINLFFVKAGSTYGEVSVAANTLLMQLFLTFSYFMDGFAYAGEALTGRYVGAKDNSSLREMLRKLFSIGAILAPLMALLYFLWGDALLGVLSDKPEVLGHALGFELWYVLIPMVSFLAFLWDGIFVGMTTSKPMMQAVTLACFTFYLVYFGLQTQIGEHALWLAFVLYLAVRSLFSLYCGLKLLSSKYSIDIKSKTGNR